MSSDHFWETMHGRWWWIAIGIAVGLALAVVALQVLPRTYLSEAAILVDAEATNGDVGTFNATSYVEDRLPTYVDLGRADSVHDDIRERLDRDLTREEIGDTVAFVPTPGSMVVLITGTAESSAESQLRADAAAGALATAIEDTSTHSVEVTTSLVQGATLPTSAEDPDPLVVVPAGALIGALVPLLLALTMDRRRPATAQEGNPS